VRDEFNLSASDNLVAPFLPISLTVRSENEIKGICRLRLRSSEVRDEFDLSASDNLIAPLLPILLSIRS
jgi:hypothetical protein